MLHFSYEFYHHEKVSRFPASGLMTARTCSGFLGQRLLPTETELETFQAVNHVSHKFLNP